MGRIYIESDPIIQGEASTLVDFHFDLRWYLGNVQSEEVEPQLFRLLQAIEGGGSVRVAAQQCELSYRYAWGLLQKWERLFGGPLALLERGRGAKLTRLGEKLLWGQRRIAARLAPELESLASELSSELRTALTVKLQPPLRVYASHGLAIALLRDMLNDQSAVKMDLQFRGSLDSLRLLAGSKCDLAGFHLPEGPLGVRLAPRYRRWLDPETQVLIHVVHRQQGIMTALGNPQRIQSVLDLARGSVRFINRQLASGTRLIFDQLLQEVGIHPDQIPGYQDEEFTHLAVAALVASGVVDVGFGIQAAASQFGLGFIPIVQENYLFVLKREQLMNPKVSELVRILKGPEFKDRIARLPGYDASHAGTIVSIEQLMRQTIL